ncbi:MAG: diguanylate cyclase [Chromatiales bacterium]|jgi:diguanylate cyclase (GGDEF)-like protein/PAS domain S-box-containing protein
MAGSTRPKSHFFSAAIIAVIYVAAAVAWIFLSEYLMVAAIEEPTNMGQHQSLKDWGFIFVTTLVLYYLVLSQLRKYSCCQHRFESQRSELYMLNQCRNSIIDNASIWINVLDRAGHVTVWNKAAEQISGYRREEVLMNEKVWELLYPADEYRTLVRKITQEVIDEGAKVQGFETIIHTKSGREKTIAWNSRRFLNEKDEVMGAIAIGRDITVQKCAVRALQDTENQLTRLMDSLPGVAFRCLNDECWTMKFISSGCLKLTGYERSELTDNREISFTSIIHEDDYMLVEREVSRALELKQPFAMEYRIRRRNGEVSWVWQQGQAVRVGKELFLEGIILDINRRKAMEQELERVAAHDPLTGLYNRRELEQHAEAELARAIRYKHPLSLLWLDVDHFKAVNDRHGRLAGDEVLRLLSHLLKASVRAVDYVARFGGEELVIIMPEVDADKAHEMAERLCNSVELTQIPLASGKLVDVTVSVGVASFPKHGREASQLFRKAYEAMNRAKQNGRNRVVKASVGLGR